MIKVLKQIPATMNGKDCNLLLVHNDALTSCTCCDLCCYRDWEEYTDVIKSCMDFNGCTPDANTYFIVEQLRKQTKKNISER